MSERDIEERSNETGISKRWQSSQTDATLFERDNCRSTFSGGPVRVPASETTGQLSTAEETASKARSRKPSVKNSTFKDFEKTLGLPSARGGCSKHCTGYNRDADAASYEMTVCTTPKKSKLAYRIKRSKRKLQKFSTQLKRKTKKSAKKIKRMYENLGAKRAVGFNCDLRKCESKLLDCSATSCAKPNMLFSKFHKLRDRIAKDKEETRHTICRSMAPTNHELRVVKEQSTGTSVEQETST